MDLSIVIPVYNSERIVPELARRIVAAVAGARPVRDYEVILVNDCSADRSWQMIEQACDAYPRCAASTFASTPDSTTRSWRACAPRAAL